MYRKLIFAASIALLSAGTITNVAATMANEHQHGQQADSAAAQLQQTLKGVENLSGLFLQEIYDNGELLQDLSGSFVLQRPAKLRWVTYEPEASELIADGETLWYYNPFIEQVTLYDQADAMQANPLLVLLDSEANWQGFTITDLGKHSSLAAAMAEQQLEVNSAEEVARHYWRISDEQQLGSELILAFHNDELQQLVLDDGQGQVSVFYLSVQQSNQTLSADTFNFNIPPGTDIDDQRE